MWVRSQPDPVTGEFLLTIDYAEDASVALTFDEGITYAMSFLEALTKAEYQAAILNQMSDKMGQQEAMTLLMDFREATTNLLKAGPMALVPGVTIGNDKYVAFVEVSPDRGDSWTWRADEVRDHTSGVLEIAHGVALDQTYYDVLTKVVGLPEASSRHIIMDLMNHRDAPWQDPDLLRPKEESE